MFEINCYGDKQLKSIIEGQFAPFIEKVSKLPSFSVTLSKLSIVETLALKEHQSLGDYSFYKETIRGFWISFKDSYVNISKDYKQADVYLSDNVQGSGLYEASYLLMQAYMYRLVDTGNFMIHSAAINYKNNGILFCGLSGAGKSTQANLWKKYLHCSVLNYDKPCIINDNGILYAHGSPWSGKERMFRNEYTPLKAIVYIVQAEKNSVRRLSPVEAASKLFLHNYVFPLTKEIETKYISIINNVALEVPIYELKCNISEEAVEVLFDSIFPNLEYRNEKKEFIMKYKTKDNFIMKEIAEEYVVIPRGTHAIEFNGTVVFNESGVFLWNQLQSYVDEKSLVLALKNKYNITENIAQEDVKAFLSKMISEGLVDTKEE